MNRHHQINAYNRRVNRHIQKLRRIGYGWLECAVCGSKSAPDKKQPYNLILCDNCRTLNPEYTYVIPMRLKNGLPKKHGRSLIVPRQVLPLVFRNTGRFVDMDTLYVKPKAARMLKRKIDAILGVKGR